MNKETNFFPTSRPKYKRVTLDLYYVVDAEDESMIQHAKDCLYEDIMSAYKSDSLYDCIRVVEAPGATEEDIPEFLLENEKQDEEYEDWLAANYERIKKD